MKRKNVKGLALTPAAPKSSSGNNNGDQKADWGAGGSRAEEAGQEAQLEIGIEFNLDLRQEDLEIVKELGSGNGGTVSKVKHLPTGTTMARKVRLLSDSAYCSARSRDLSHSHLKVGN